MRIPQDVDTPAVVVDAERLERNLTAMASAASAAGVALRPHAKTHKCPQIARMQLERGAVGLTVATLAEAEAFAAVGCPSVFIAYPLWATSNDRPERIMALRAATTLTVGVDSVAAASALAEAAPSVRVMIEVDSGQHRSGVPPTETRRLAEFCLSAGLDVAGAFTHPGHSYGGADAVAAAVADEHAALAAAGAALAETGIRAPELSGGSSPTAAAESSGSGWGPLTEVRPGTYVFGDRQQMALSGLAADDVALVVAARVVSAQRPGEAVLDAGSKALSSDRPGWLTGHGLILEAPEATIVSLSEEHAVVRGPARGPERGLGESRLAVGDLVRVVPNHVCPVVNLTGSLLVARDGAIVDRWPVVARRLPVLTARSLMRNRDSSRNKGLPGTSGL
jgi:D-serine deaminase-like pyridoxal phosphate-dependent protein